ncbi:hypothetical protein ACVWXU_003767 [Streptomyces sp. TE33382]
MNIPLLGSADRPVTPGRPASEGHAFSTSPFAPRPVGRRVSWGKVREDWAMANRLAQTTSPYLLQHAGNPVDWWPWSPEAFEEARRRNLPVLLSVGYASCHWCQRTC